MSENGHEIAVIPFRTVRDLYRWMHTDPKTAKKFYEYITRNVKLAIQNEWESVEIFRLANTNSFAKLHERDYTNTLEKVRSFAIQFEHYELAEACQQTIYKNEILKLIGPQ